MMRGLVAALLFALVFVSGAEAQIYYPAPEMSAYALTAAVPTPAMASPPCIADAGAVGTGPTVYALANHTHCSKVRKDKLTSGTNGLLTVTFGTPFTAGVVPVCVATAFPAAGTTDIINVQGEGPPTNTQATFRVNRSTPTANGLLGVTINVVPAAPGAQLFHYACFEP